MSYLDQETRDQLAQYFELLEQPVTLTVSVDDQEASQKFMAFIDDIVALSPKLSIAHQDLARTPSVMLSSEQVAGRVTFCGIPMGHELTSFILALLQVSGRAPVIDEADRQRIEAIDERFDLTTYVSLTCQNCPDIVQALNMMSVLNPKITHTMVEGGMFKSEVEARDIRAVPTVYRDETEWTSGRKTLHNLLDLMGAPQTATETKGHAPFDVLVIGGGPAGASAAIYAARKGVRVGLIAEEFGGQVLETLGIENFIGTPYTEGPRLMANIREHVNAYDITLIEGQLLTAINPEQLRHEVVLSNGDKLISKTLIIATGAHWRLLGIPGEQSLKNKGVSYCPHCDGPIFKDKDIAVIGGGNSGVEAALDMAHYAKRITLLEYSDTLRADPILQERLREKANVDIVFGADTQAILGESGVEGLTYVDRQTGERHQLALSGVFPLIGLQPNTGFLPEAIEKNGKDEIVVDPYGQTTVEGIFAAGDCTDVIYKQIVIALGSGATAALGAFDYLMRQGL